MLTPGLYWSRAEVTWDMPTADTPYVLLQLGRQGTDWSIPVLAFGLYTGNFYTSMRGTSDGVNYTNTAWVDRN